MKNKYDAIIIGAGMSGLAAGIRLAMFDQKVVILEKHTICGGLNSYYTRRIRETKELVNFDVGLHALTNFAKKGEKKRPLTKLLKQLRIPYDSLHLKEQSHSLIHFKSAKLKFSNDLELLRSEIFEVFPNEIDNFDRFTNFLLKYNEVDLKAHYRPARQVLDKYFNEDLLKEMIIAPLLIYGSAWENDMDFSQFVIMFKSLYIEGFSRPEGGVRTIIDLLIQRYKEVGGELRFRASVESIMASRDRVTAVKLKNGEVLETKKILSSAGLPETFKLLNKETNFKPKIGKLSFTESIYLVKDKTNINDFESTIVFYNDSDTYQYQKPNKLFDPSSCVFCLPDNYDKNDHQGYGTIRVTHMANYDQWKRLEKNQYKLEKEAVFKEAQLIGEKLIGNELDVIFKDVFTPTTVERYTNHLDGTVYGSSTKLRDGKTEVDGLYIIGTDQGFLGIVGSMLSGISMANLHGLMDS